MHFPTKALTAGSMAAALLVVPAPPAGTQSLLDRPDNVSADWIGNTGTLYFNFVHRFTNSPAPEHKVTNLPTFLIATGFASQGLVGFNYASNSSLARRYPNEWEFFGRYAPMQQEDGAPFDLGSQIDYNLAVKGVDGEVSIARREGPFRVIGVARTVADTLGGSKRRFSFGGGGTFRMGRFLALAGDATTLTSRGPTEKIAWSAGLHIALPNTPHTLSIHMSNANTSTLQGLARGGSTRRYGFEFTIPIHVSRFFSSPEAVVDNAPAIPAPVVDTVAPARPANVPAPVVAQPNVPAPTPTPTPTPSPSPAQPRPTDTTAARPATERPAARPTPAPSRPTAQAPAPRAASKSVTARMKGQAFIPAVLEIDAGTTVHWKNLDALIHTVTAVDKSFNSGVIAADGSYSHTFSRPGTIPIYCIAHPFMKATIVVK